jgi:hypothetical protein
LHIGNRMQRKIRTGNGKSVSILRRIHMMDVSRFIYILIRKKKTFHILLRDTQPFLVGSGILL